MQCPAADVRRLHRRSAHAPNSPLATVCHRSTYDQKWQEAMAELNEQVHIEDDTLDLEEGDEPPPVRRWHSQLVG